MKKILLIEDRLTRQNTYLNAINLSLDKYADILDNATATKYEVLYEAFKKNSFNLNGYVLVMVHKGAFNGENSEISHQLIEYCKENRIPLVRFSGGASNYYHKEEGLELMELNSNDFYSQNIRLFLDNFQATKEIELLILSYGKDWKLNIVLNRVEKINRFIAENENNEDIVYESFINTTSFNLLEKTNIDFYQPEVEEGWVYLKELKKVAQSIENYIEEVIVYEK